MATDVVFIPALLCDEALYRDVITAAGDAINAHVMISPRADLAESVADILSQAPARFALVGTSYGGNLALEVALAAPERVTALWLMGCDPAAPQTGGPDLAGGLTAQPDAVIDMLAGLVVHQDATACADIFKTMAHHIGGKAGAAQATALATRREATSRLGALHMPAMVLWGKDDAIVPVAVGRSLADDLPHAHFHVLKDCGHLPTLEKPAESAALFLEFLADEPHHHHHH
ncbi:MULTISPECIES: alpha/beta fold hydrolase [Acidiphilium]|uniref:Pimeloyl-ACP methyl ester carboxylesterase n=1 Tax=Acidiphilium rubrum TaxID=526 RepID=A0A8G2FC05_ACIRU|nr:MULTISPECIES: alpha/beta fold hydrolase [Acidiphilium]MBW4035343.1 alpha/beta fold hydrolase [Pseudomonadota bacterium]SIQ16082.1 Pimeloyl-ACP methyl ester carboxylesterase [Acidiphilium rubrum]